MLSAYSREETINVKKTSDCNLKVLASYIHMVHVHSWSDCMILTFYIEATSELLPSLQSHLVSQPPKRYETDYCHALWKIRAYVW